jgi:ATP-dependent Clp protease ATP-binding subunit ClpC
VQCIGATTLDEYRKYIEKDGALERRFQTVNVEPPSPEQTIEILKGLRDKYEAHHRVDLHRRRVPDGRRPQHALHHRPLPAGQGDRRHRRGGRRIRIKSMTAPPDLRDMDTEIARLNKEKEEAVAGQDFERAADLRDQAFKLGKKKEEIQREWRERENSRESGGMVDEDVIAETVSKMTGIPLNRLDQAEAERLINMEKELGKDVINQERAIAAIAKAVRRSRAGSRTRTGRWAASCSSARRASARPGCRSASPSSCSAARTRSSRSTCPSTWRSTTPRGSSARPPGYVGYEEAAS